MTDQPQQPAGLFKTEDGLTWTQADPAELPLDVRQAVGLAPAVITDEQLDELGRIADTVDNLRAALHLPLPPALHIEGMRESLPEVVDRIKTLYRQLGGTAFGPQ